MKFYIKLLLITKVENQKLNKKMKLLDQHLKYMHKKVQVMQDMLVEKLQFLLGWCRTWSKGKMHIKKEN